MSSPARACEDLRHELGAYVLGSLPSDEEAAVREHLARCTACRHEHARLAGLVPLLDLAHAAAERPVMDEPSPLLEEAVLAGFAEERGSHGDRSRAGRKQRRRFALPAWRVALPSAALGAVLAVGVLALAGVLSGDGAGAPATTVDLRGEAGSARAVLHADEVGTVIELDATLPPSARRDHYDVVMLSGDYEISAGTFRVGADGRVSVELACGGPPEVYDKIEIRRSEKTVLTAPLPA
ncbi:MAG TPA: zf-HC2 domain-containing protein [Solirubrobacteraceae bacterium]|nr:zf-HC2 domain-containing protein [Solirubrobacteraceae bacterium]